MGENHVTTLAVVLYGVVLILTAVAYFILCRVLLAGHASDSALAKAIGSDFKGKVSLVIYAVGIALAFVGVWLGIALYVLVAIMWLVPDRRIEKALAS